jgi:uncharacterized protein
MMRYNASTLLKAPVGAKLDFAVEEGRYPLRGDLTLHYVHGRVKLTQTGRRIMAQGDFQTEFAVECVRCLETLALPLRIRFEELLTFFPANPPDKTYHIGEDGYLNLEPILHEQIVLAMPLQTVCRPDCRGLCSQCGQNLNQGDCNCTTQGDDPRMAVLGTLL